MYILDYTSIWVPITEVGLETLFAKGWRDESLLFAKEEFLWTETWPEQLRRVQVRKYFGDLSRSPLI